MPNQRVPVGLENSIALQYVIGKGWSWEEAGGDQIKIQNCPYCSRSDFKFYMACSAPESGSRDGLNFCHACKETGNLRRLQEHCGDRVQGVDSRADWAGGKAKILTELPDVEAAHAALLSDAETLDYLMNVRKFSMDIIKKQKLGVKEKHFFHKAGETKAIVTPYLSSEGNVTWVKYRTVPPHVKDFSSPHGEAGLYNAGALNEDCKEIILCEGENDCISLLDHGIIDVCGVPGANVKKASWIEALDRINPKIYILFDTDGPGNKGAQELAQRIGLEKCLKIRLPKTVKDIGEWFAKGGAAEELQTLKEEAVMFDVGGVVSSGDALQDLEDKLEGREDLAPTYVSQWPELNKLVGWEDGDVLDIVGEAKRGKTVLAMNILDHMVKTYNEPGLLCCLEMLPERLARKWVSIVTGFEDSLVAPGTPEAKAKLIELKECIIRAKEEQRNRTADLYFAYPQMVRDPEDVFKLIRDCIRRYGVKWVCLDNIQRLCDDTLRSQNMRTIHLSQISKGLTKIAKDYKVKMIRIVQPKKIASGAIVTSADVDGSSQIDKDTDAMIVLHRRSIGVATKSAYEEESDNYSESEESFDSRMRVTVGLSRYSSGGHCDLLFDGAKSQVRSYDASAKLPQQQAFNSLLPMEKPTAAVKIPTENIPI
jgi:5S rRNA maturation endonuclease (ribonuclease M5)/replicative DNA helicase